LINGGNLGCGYNVFLFHLRFLGNLGCICLPFKNYSLRSQIYDRKMIFMLFVSECCVHIDVVFLHFLKNSQVRIWDFLRSIFSSSGSTGFCERDIYFKDLIMLEFLYESGT
jgi:hypothetical protein